MNYFWVAKTLVTTASYQGMINFRTTAGMRLNHHGNFKVQLFEQIKKKTTVPLVLLCPTLPYTCVDPVEIQLVIKAQ